MLLRLLKSIANWIYFRIRPLLNLVGIDLVRSNELEELRNIRVQKGAVDIELQRVLKRQATLEHHIAMSREEVLSLRTFRPHEAAEEQKPVEKPSISDLVSSKKPKIPICDVSEHGNVVSAYRNYGAVVVKNVLPGDWMQEYLHRATDYVSYLEDGQETKYGGHFYSSLASTHSDNLSIPAGIQNILNPLKDSGIIDSARDFYGSELFFMPDYSSIRRVVPIDNEGVLTWHQDGAAVANQTADQYGVVFWIPLTRVDKDTPGLKIVCRHFDTLYEHVPLPSGYNKVVDSSLINDKWKDYICTTPDMDIGDIMIISFTTLHCTYIRPEMTKTRYSIDLRASLIRHVPNYYKGWLVIP